MYDIQFFIIILALVATTIPLFSELFILPKNIKNYKRQEVEKYKEQFRNTYHIVFFYFLFISLTLKLYDYISPITIQHFVMDCVIFIYLIIIILFLLSKLKIDERTNTGVLTSENKFDSIMFFSFFCFFFLILLDLNPSKDSIFGIDKTISNVVGLSTIVLYLLYRQLIKIKKDSITP